VTSRLGTGKPITFIKVHAVSSDTVEYEGAEYEAVLHIVHKIHVSMAIKKCNLYNYKSVL
jgi:hypothetical protein